MLPYSEGLELRNYLICLWILWQKQSAGQMKNKKMTKHSQDISTYRTKTE